MKKTLTLLSIVIATATFAQQQPSKPVHLEGKEVDSTKQRLIVLSQKVSQLSCATQGQAAELQVLIGELFQTIVRKEEKEPQKTKQ